MLLAINIWSGIILTLFTTNIVIGFIVSNLKDLPTIKPWPHTRQPRVA